MSTPLPKYISLEDLLARLKEEVATLDDSELAWWRQYSVSPFPMRHVCSVYGEMYHFVVAVRGSDILFFSDGYDYEFGHAKLEAGIETMKVDAIIGKLREAINSMTP
jgi:hypothetical protein